MDPPSGSKNEGMVAAGSKIGQGSRNRQDRHRERSKSQPQDEREHVQRGIGEEEWPALSLEQAGGDGGSNLLSVQLDPAPLFSVLGTISNQIGLLRGEVLYVKKTADSMKDIRNEMKEFAENAKNEMDSARKDMEEALHNAKEDMEKNLEDWKREIDDDASKAKKDLDYSREQISDALEEARRAASDFRIIHDGLKELHDRVDEVNNHAEDASHRAENCQTGLCDLQQAMNVLKGQMGVLEDDIERVSRPNTATMKDLEKGTGKLQNLLDQSELNDMKKRLDKMERGLDEKSDQLKRLEAGLTDKGTQLMQLEAGLRAAQAQAQAQADKGDGSPVPVLPPSVEVTNYDDRPVVERLERLEAKYGDLAGSVNAMDNVVTTEVARLSNEMKPLKLLPENLHEVRYDVGGLRNGLGEMECELGSLKKELKEWAERPLLVEAKKGSVEDLLFAEKEKSPPLQTKTDDEKPKETVIVEKFETIREVMRPIGPDQDEWLRGRLRPLFSALESLMSDSNTSSARLGDLRDRLNNLEREKNEAKYKEGGMVSQDEFKAGLNLLQTNLGGVISKLQHDLAAESRRNSLANKQPPPAPVVVQPQEAGVDPARIDGLERTFTEQLEGLFGQVGNLFDMVGKLQEKLGDTDALANAAFQKSKRPPQQITKKTVNGDGLEASHIRNNITELMKQTHKLETELDAVKKTANGNSIQIEQMSNKSEEQENKLNSVCAQANFLGSQLDTLRSSMLKQITDDIKRLQKGKLDNVEKHKYALKEDMLNKVDVRSLRHLEGTFDGFQQKMREELDNALRQLEQLQESVQKQLNRYRDNLKKKLIHAVKMVQTQNAATNANGTDIGRIGYKCVVCDQPTPMKGGIVPVQAPGLFPSQMKRGPVQGMSHNIDKDPVVFRGGFRMPGRSMNHSGVIHDAGERVIASEGSPVVNYDDYDPELSQTQTAREMLTDDSVKDTPSRPTSAPATHKKHPIPPSHRLRVKGRTTAQERGKAFITMQQM